MGLDYHFYAQFFRDDQWVVPPEFQATQGFRRGLGYFVWFNQSDLAFRQIFVGNSAMISLRREQPHGIASTELFRRCAHAWDEWYLGHVGLEELMLDSWSDTFQHIALDVEPRLAHAFTDGNQSFPEKSLLQLGMSQPQIDEMTSTHRRRFVDGPIVHRPQNSQFIEVTWKANLVELIVEWRYQALFTLREFGRDEDIRIICHRC